MMRNDESGNRGRRVDRGEGLTIIEVAHPEYWANVIKGQEIQVGNAIVYRFVKVLGGNRLLVRRVEKPT